MPLLDLQCKCGHRFEAIRSFSVSDPDAERCPECGGTDLAALPSSFLPKDRVRSTEGMDPLERELHLENKAYLEANSERILDGSLGVASLKECPVEFRPVCPERLRKQYF